MPRKLKVWNGLCINRKSIKDDPRWTVVAFNQTPSMYVCAYSRADARRVVGEYFARIPSESEAKNSWSGCWGRKMDGIEPERGLWIQFDQSETPVRVV